SSGARGQDAGPRNGLAAGLIKEGVLKSEVATGSAGASAPAAVEIAETDENFKAAKMACSILNGEECEACQ
ncbi:MAG TPA: hypothetical protein VK465_04385, partial [Fibrobacteria bacterium]|nr:hypothetical protein [Fibrobacteria bacterium]